MIRDIIIIRKGRIVMALRTIRTEGDSVLTKKCRPVDKITPRILELIEDMLDTMYDADGVGLAGPQVGVLTIAPASMKVRINPASIASK